MSVCDSQHEAATPSSVSNPKIGSGLLLLLLLLLPAAPASPNEGACIRYMANRYDVRNRQMRKRV